MSDQNATRWEQFNEAGRLFFQQGDLPRAEEAFRSAIDEAEQPGGDRLRLAASLSNLAQLKYQQRALDDAEALFARSIEIRSAALGADHPSVSQTLNNLAALHVARGRPESAEPLLTRALAIVEKHRPSDHPDVATTLNNLAKLYFKRGDFAAAEPLMLRLLTIRQGSGADNLDVANVLASLATLRQALGRADSAEQHWREALALRERSLRPNDPALAPTLEGLADACAAQGRRDEAIVARERALAVRERAFGADHATVAAARARLAELRAGGDGPAATRHEPRMSSMRMTAIEGDGAPAVPDERPVPSNPWLLEAEPPRHILDTSASAAPPAAPAPVTPQPPPGPPARPSKPVPLRNSELASVDRPPGSTTLPPVAPAEPAGVSSDAGIWWSPEPAPRQAEPPAPPPSPEPPRRSAAVRAPVPPPPAPRAPMPPAAPPPAAIVAPLPPPPPKAVQPAAPRPVSRPPRVEPRPAPRAEPRRRPREPRRAPAPRFAEQRRSSGRPFATMVVIAALAVAGWFAMTRGRSAVAAVTPEPRPSVPTKAAPPRQGAATSPGAAAGRVGVPASPRTGATSGRTYSSAAAARAAEDSAALEAAREAARPTTIPELHSTSLDATIAAGFNVEKVVRAIDDSTRKRLDAALPKVDVKAAEFKKQP